MMTPGLSLGVRFSERATEQDPNRPLPMIN